MTKYFKGSIIDVRKLKTYTYILDLIDENNDNNDNYLKNLDVSLNKLLKSKKYSKKEEIDQSIINLFKPNIINEIGIPIIYCKKNDEQKEYGQELITKMIFPIKNEYSDFDVTYSLVNTQYSYLDKETNCLYSFEKAYLPYNYCLVDGHPIRELIIPRKEQNKMFKMGINDEIEIILFGKKVRLTCVEPHSYRIEIKPKMTFLNGDKVKYAIANETLADYLDVRNYLEVFEVGFGKRKRRKEHQELLHSMFIHNKLCEPVIINDDKEKKLIKKI